MARSNTLCFTHVLGRADFLNQPEALLVQNKDSILIRAGNIYLITMHNHIIGGAAQTLTIGILEYILLNRIRIGRKVEESKTAVNTTGYTTIVDNQCTLGGNILLYLIFVVIAFQTAREEG